MAYSCELCKQKRLWKQRQPEKEKKTSMYEKDILADCGNIYLRIERPAHSITEAAHHIQSFLFKQCIDATESNSDNLQASVSYNEMEECT